MSMQHTVHRVGVLSSTHDRHEGLFHCSRLQFCCTWTEVVIANFHFYQSNVSMCYVYFYLSIGVLFIRLSVSELWLATVELYTVVYTVTNRPGDKRNVLLFPIHWLWLIHTQVTNTLVWVQNNKAGAPEMGRLTCSVLCLLLFVDSPVKWHSDSMLLPKHC